MHSRQHMLALAVSQACILAASGAFAAETAGEEPPAADAERVVMLERVVATAQKRSEDIMQVPATISVLDGDWLEASSSRHLTDFAAHVPGFQVDSQGAPGKVSLALRGLAPIGTSATVGTYIDDTPLGSSGQMMAATSYALDLLPYDVESVEVLSGPQGTLYGASAMGGLVKYVTRDADVDYTELRAGVEVNSVDGASSLGHGARASFNLPIAPGRAGLRASVARNEVPGYIDNLALGTRDQNGYEQLAGRMALTWDLSDHARLRLQGIWQRLDADNTTRVALDAQGHPLGGAHGSVSRVPEPYANDLDYYAATLDWDLGWAEFVSASSYSRSSLGETQDMSATYGPLFPLFGLAEGLSDIRLAFELEKWTQEFRLMARPSDRLEWLAGAFFTGEDGTQLQNLLAYDQDGAPIAALNPMADVALPNRYREDALFSDITYWFSPAFDASVGARVARNRQDYAQINSGALVGDGNTPGRSSETVSTWKLSARWRPGADTMVYGRIATGYRPGGPNVSLPGVPPMVESDTTVNYELGFKTDLFDRRASLEVAAFRIDWDDMQLVAFTDTGLSYLDNSGGATSQGVELSSLLRPAAGMTLGLNAAWIDARLDDSVPPASGMVAGARMPMTPEFSWSATFDYDFPLANGLDANVGAAYRNVGKRTGMQGFPIDGYRALDLQAGLGNQAWSLRLFVRNATNSKGHLSIAPVLNGATGAVSYLNGVPLQPRTIGLAIDYRY